MERQEGKSQSSQWKSSCLIIYLLRPTEILEHAYIQFVNQLRLDVYTFCYCTLFGFMFSNYCWLCFYVSGKNIFNQYVLRWFWIHNYINRWCKSQHSLGEVNKKFHKKLRLDCGIKVFLRISNKEKEITLLLICC